MDFIEWLFGVSPDGGSGWLEITYFVVGTAAVRYWTAWRSRIGTRAKAE